MLCVEWKLHQNITGPSVLKKAFVKSASRIMWDLPVIVFSTPQTVHVGEYLSFFKSPKTI